MLALRYAQEYFDIPANASYPLIAVSSKYDGKTRLVESFTHTGQRTNMAYEVDHAIMQTEMDLFFGDADRRAPPVPSTAAAARDGATNASEIASGGTMRGNGLSEIDRVVFMTEQDRLEHHKRWSKWDT